MRRQEITVDERGRTSLARVRRQKHERYRAEEYPDGTLVLTPLVTVPVASLKAPPARAEKRTA
jgi:hypothetical protein